MTYEEFLVLSKNLLPYDFSWQHDAVKALIAHLRKWVEGYNTDAQWAEEKSEGVSSGYFTMAVYADAAYCHSAVAALAPLFEGMFVHEFEMLRLIHRDVGKLNDDKRWALSPDEFWNPKLVVEKGEAIKGDNIHRGTFQLLRALDCLHRFPADFKEVTEALFTYRNRSLHSGYEWPLKDRDKFRQLAKDRHWDEKWFSWATEGSGENEKPWITFMTEQFISRCLECVKETASVFGGIRFAREHRFLGRPAESSLIIRLKDAGIEIPAPPLDW